MIPILVTMVLTIVVGLWLTRPLWRRAARADLDREGANVAAFRSRRAEIEREREAGLIDAATAEALERELAAGVLADADADERTAPPRGGGRAVTLAVVLFVACAIGAALLYAADGSWRTAGWIELAKRDPQAARRAAADATIAAMEADLRRHPDDARRLEQLAQGYAAVGRPGDALPLWTRLNRQAGDNPDWLVAEGETRLAVAGSEGDPLARERFEQAVAIAPGHGRALWYAGLLALQAGDLRITRARWAALAGLDLPHDMRTLLERRLAEIDDALERSAAGDPAVRAAAEGATAPPADGTRMRVAVRVAPSLADDYPPDATLFVFARAPDGPPLPLAVYRGMASELPVEITLDDSMAMTPSATLSQHDRWAVSARISRAGQAMAAAGDLQGSRIVTREELGDSIDIVIDSRLP